MKPALHALPVLCLLGFLAHAQNADDRRVAPIIAHKQIALVIGNATYTNTPRLTNPQRDAEAMATRLRELNYDATLVIDADRKTMFRAIDKFVEKLGTGDVAFFYYSGHGVQVDGENYLIPVDYQGQDETDVRSDAYSAGHIQERMERSGAQLNILVLDACRNNPYRSSIRGGLGGLAFMNPGRGTFIAFATAPGRTASDNRGGNNGLFTTYLLDALSAPGLGLNDVFDFVREKVDAASKGAQLPWTLSSVVGRYSFVPGGIPPAPRPPVVMDRGPQPGQVKINPKDGQRYVWIPPGSFIMGCSPGDTECWDNEKPAHSVSITKGFWLGQTSVTVALWKRYRTATGKPALPDNDTFGRKLNEVGGNDNLPAVAMTWDEAQGFCEWSGGRLPTEAEWEYAARAGDASPRYGKPESIAWYADNSGKVPIKSTEFFASDPATYGKRLYENGNLPHPVGLKEPNAWNLYDMIGNVWQWTSDWYGEKYYGQKESADPQGPPGGESRSLRGAGWIADPRYVRVSVRFRIEPGVRGVDIGVRCIGELTP